MMWIAVIASLICFALATILFTPSLREYPFYQPFAFYFLFEGAWMFCNWVILELFGSSAFMLWVQYIGSILFGGYLVFCLYRYAYQKKCDEIKTEEQNNKKDC